MASVRPEFVIGAAKAPRPKTLKGGEGPMVRDDLSCLLAHDLKTPLAAIAMNLDFALGELAAETNENVKSALMDCRDANARAIRIVTDMADAVRLTLGDRRATCGDVSLAKVVRGVVARALAEADGRGVDIALRTDEADAHIDLDLLPRALDRLLERALRHARSGTRIHVDQLGTTVTIRVATMPEIRKEPAGPTLATCFAEAALRAQAGTLSIERDGLASLVYRVVLPG